MSYRHITRFVLSTAILLALTTEVRAQTDYWSGVNGPFGGTTVWDLERTAGGQIFAATSNGVFQSVDQGQSWENVSDGLVQFDVRDLHARDDGSLWAATWGTGLYRLPAGDDTWHFAALANIFTSTVLEPEPGLLLAGSNGFVYRSVGSAGSWSAHTLQGFDVAVQDLSSNSEYLFAATSLGIFRSSDMGLNWEFASTGLQEYNVVSIETNDVGSIFAGINPENGGCSIYRSRGNGTLWTCVQPFPDPFTVAELKVGPEGHIFAGGYRNLFESADDGSSWSASPASGSGVQSMLFLESSILIGTQGEGILRSTDNGASWNASSQGLDSQITVVRALDDGRLVAGTNGGLFISTDLGVNWQRGFESEPLIQKITDIDLDAEGQLIAATTVGVWKLTASNGWTALGPPGMPSIRDIDITSDGTILAGYHAGVYFFDGHSWAASTVQGSDQAFRDISAVIETDSGAILAGASWDAWRRDLSGNGWQVMASNTAPWFDVQTFAKHEGRILGGTRFSAVVESWDDGVTWHNAGTGLVGSEDIRSVEFDRNGTPHITTYGSGVFQLNPWSGKWLPMNGGLEGHERVTSIAFDGYGNAFVGTVDGGLFSHITAGVAVEESTELPDRLSLGAPFPNPALNRISLPIVMASPSRVDIDVFDMLGRRVQSSSTYILDTTAEMALDVSKLNAGLYLYRVRSGASSKSGSFSVIN